ncbi:hypothetical protein PILCRDRAFT_561513 [Piloderma croceum F 1598]|uniref:Uncharacterized protein n=1 Tax=Piloderma croceum (strain F 1598) TaxID=765440 RepID=A0A0C3FI24_PILCF|nr:hypothetical protein PILCRDRAFT_561513 [Piloderma croceum F 1598]
MLPVEIAAAPFFNAIGIISGSGRKHRHAASCRLTLKLLRYSSSGTPCNNIAVDRSIRAASGFLIFRRNSAWQTNAFIVITKHCPSPIFCRKHEPAYHSVAPSLSSQKESAATITILRCVRSSFISLRRFCLSGADL